MLHPITERLATLPSLNKPALSKMWEDFFDVPPPPKLRRDLMVRILGYRLQEQTSRSLGSRSVARLHELAKRFGSEGDSAGGAPIIKPGTRLVRQWRSETHVVHVEEQGYEYKGSRYHSLSEIARMITGTPRSGPLFFGVRGKRVGESKEAA
jgi:hypothetical protein